MEMEKGIEGGEGVVWCGVVWCGVVRRKSEGSEDISNMEVSKKRIKWKYEEGSRRMIQ